MDVEKELPLATVTEHPAKFDMSVRACLGLVFDLQKKYRGCMLSHEIVANP